MFIVDLNATIRRDFTNPMADYQKVRLEIGVGVDGDTNRYGAWDKKIGFFIGNAGKSRGQSPRYLCHVIKSPDDRLPEFFQSYLCHIKRS